MSRIPGGEATHSAIWGADDIGDLSGRVALITGANSGIGYETAGALALHGAHVIMACRNGEKARQARDKLESELERSSLELLALDLADLVSVRRAAETVLGRHARLDILVNNAGVMGTPYRQTADGLELQMATNHFGHFALTGLLLDRLVTTERSRIVTVSSQMHRVGHLRLDDLGGGTPRNTWVVYGASKLANLLFTAELSRRLAAADLTTGALAAHPGWTRSNLAGSGAALGTSRIRRRWDGRPGGRSGSRLRRGPCRSCVPPRRRPCTPANTSDRRTCSSSTGLRELVRPSRRARDEAAAVDTVACLRGADRRALFGGCRGLTATAARRRDGVSCACRAGIALQESGVSRRAVRAQDAAEHHDHHRVRAPDT